MGILDCSCSVAVATDGTIDVGVISVDYDLTIGICPDCELEDSGVTGTLTITPPLLPPVVVDLDLTVLGLPICADNILSVEVQGEILGELLTLNLTLNDLTGEICLSGLPVVDELCVTAAFDILDCTTP